MKEDSCARWAVLADRAAIGEPLGELDAAFLRRHADTCEPCGAEARVYAELASFVSGETPAGQALPPTRRSDAARGGAREDDRRRTRAVAAGVSLALAGIAATMTLYMRAQHPHPAIVERAAVGTVTLLEGETALAERAAGAEVREGATLATGHGRACIRIEPGIRVCIGENTRVRLDALRAPARVLRLERGRLAAELEPQPAGSSFSIATPDGSVTAIGTAFSVEVADGAPSSARVLHGVVLVRAAHDERPLRAHEETRFDQAPRPLAADEEQADRALLREGAPTTTRHPARVTLESEPPGAVLRIDGAPVGATPLDLVVEPGPHALAIEGADPETRIVLHEGEHFAKTWALRAAAVPAEPEPRATAVAPAVPPPPTSSDARSAPVLDARSAHAQPDSDKVPSALLTSAQAAQSRGDVEAAARAYRMLLSNHPRSAEADAAVLSLAELELARGAYAEALALFDRYIAARGPLVLEARYGRIRALRALGRTADERAATAEFVRDYGDSPQADALRARAP